MSKWSMVSSIFINQDPWAANNFLERQLMGVFVLHLWHTSGTHKFQFPSTPSLSWQFTTNSGTQLFLTADRQLSWFLDPQWRAQHSRRTSKFWSWHTPQYQLWWSPLF
jgi:hypothetical protein